VVEDYEPARHVRTRVLERAGYVVVEAATAEEALTRSGDVSLVLLDVRLPDGDGFSICERLKTRSPDLPVVMITSVYRTTQARRDAFSLGADAFLLEPVAPEQLLHVIDTVLRGGTDREGMDRRPPT
jgi:DNA-binding response OmpR family regulator